MEIKRLSDLEKERDLRRVLALATEIDCEILLRGIKEEENE
jgi:hypothetical protein